MQETEPLEKVTSIRVDQNRRESLFYLNLPNLTKLTSSFRLKETIPKQNEQIPKFFKNTPLLQDLYFYWLYDSHLQIILDVCPLLKKIKFDAVKADPDFEDTVTVNLDSHPQLEIIKSVFRYSKEIKIVCKKDINAKLKELTRYINYTFSDNLLLLALE